MIFVKISRNNQYLTDPLCLPLVADFGTPPCTCVPFLPSYLPDIFHIDVFLGQGHVADYSQVQRVDDLRVWRYHAIVQLGILVDVEEPGGELPDAVPLPVHEQAAAVGVDQGTDPFEDLENHLLHVDVLLHVFDQVVHDLTFFNLGTERWCQDV